MEIPHQVELVDLAKGEQNTPKYRSEINSFGCVPALKHKDQVIIESGAIMMYLADIFPEKNFAPALGTPERGLYYEWFMLILATLEPAILAIPTSQNPEEAKKEVQLILEKLEKKIGDKFAVGEQFTAVDVLLQGELWWMDQVLQILPENLPKLREYYSRIEERFSWE